MKHTTISPDVASAALNAMGAKANGGFLRLYDGKKPYSPVLEPAATLLAELRLGNPAFYPANGFEMSSRPIRDDDAARESGAATWSRVVAADGKTGLWDGTVGKRIFSGDADTEVFNITMRTVEISLGARVSIPTITINLPRVAS